MGLEKVAGFKRVAIRCICTLLEANPRFNFRESLLGIVMKNISSTDDVIRFFTLTFYVVFCISIITLFLLAHQNGTTHVNRKLCCNTIKSLFTNEGKHGGEVTVEAVQLIANLVKAHDCDLHPDSVEVIIHVLASIYIL